MPGFFRNKDKPVATKKKVKLPAPKKDEETDESDSYGYDGNWDARDYDSYGSTDSGYENHPHTELTVAEAALSRLDSTLFYNDYSTLGTGDDSTMSSHHFAENRKKQQKEDESKPLSDVATESFRAMSLSGTLVVEALGLDGIISAPDCMQNPEKNLVDSTKVVPAGKNGRKSKNAKGQVAPAEDDDGPTNPCAMCSPMRQYQQLCGAGALLDDTLDDSTDPTNAKKTGKKSLQQGVRGQKLIVRPQTMSGAKCVTKALISPRKNKKMPSSQRKFLGGLFHKKQVVATKKPIVYEPNIKPTRSKSGSARHERSEILYKTEEHHITAKESIHTITVGISQW